MGHQTSSGGFTALIRKIAVFSIALGLAVMILSLAILTGFQNEIREKVIGFGGHIQITNFDYNLSYEAQPIRKDQEDLQLVKSIEGVRHAQVFATKPGIIKTDEDIHGIILKGVGTDFDWSFFGDKIVDGSSLVMDDTLRSDQVVISQYVANRLQISVEDDIFIYFIQDPPRIRRLTVGGIYHTDLEELDRIFVLGDIRHIQQLNDWQEDQVGGYEVLVDGFDRIPEVREALLDKLPYHLDAISIRNLYPQIFDWLSLLDMNVYVIIVLIVMVAAINMITTLLIAVLEKTNLIGILKAVGGSDSLIRKIFISHAGLLILKGLFWGNAVGLILCLFQAQFGLLTLSPESYYLTEVPVNVEWKHIILLNLGTFITSVAMLLIPSQIITRISPVKAITFK